MRESDHLATLGRWYVRHVPGTLGKASLAARMNTYLRERPRRRAVHTRFGATLEIDTQDLIQRYIYTFGVWEPHLTYWLRRRLKPGDAFVDVGANLGYFSLLAADLVGDGGQVVAIEASPAFHALMLQQVRRNPYRSIRAVNAAVSDRTELLTFVLASTKNMGANSIVPYDGPAESRFEMEARPLSELLDKTELSNARVIKVDVEGAEGAVMRGLYPVMGQLRKDAEIAVEVTPSRMAKLGDAAPDLIDTMHQHGFHTYRLANDYAPESYPKAVRNPAVPVRLSGGAITHESDLIFSRIDAETLP
ncbi:FkbM family methyltransferase [Streptomyces nanshensis]|nr:FkbM family methyltransferase [Streptomyces nanshensis]